MFGAYSSFRSFPAVNTFLVNALLNTIPRTALFVCIVVRVSSSAFQKECDIVLTGGLLRNTCAMPDGNSLRVIGDAMTRLCE